MLRIIVLVVVFVVKFACLAKGLTCIPKVIKGVLGMEDVSNEFLKDWGTMLAFFIMLQWCLPQGALLWLAG